MNPPSGDHDGLHNDTSVHERQSVEEAHDMQSLLKEPIILSQLNQVNNDDDGEIVEKQNNQLTTDDSTVDTANTNIFSSPSIPVRTNVSSKSAPVPVFGHIYTQLSQDLVGDRGMDNKEESYHLQSADNTLATASHSTYLTPCSGA